MGQYLFGLKFGIIFSLVHKTTFVFVKNRTAGSPGGLVSEQNELIIHLKLPFFVSYHPLAVPGSL